METNLVPPHALERALTHLRNGGRLVIAAYGRPMILDGKALKRFEAAGYWLLKEDGDGYRLRSGKSSVYILPGLLRFA